MLVCGALCESLLDCVSLRWFSVSVRSSLLLVLDRLTLCVGSNEQLLTL